MSLPPPAASLVTDLDALEALAPAWSELLADSFSDEPTLSPDWLLTWWDVYGKRDGRRLRVVRFDEGGRLVGLAPLLTRRHWYRPGIPFRRLEAMGSGEAEADAVCSDYLSVLARKGREEGVARAFAGALRGLVGGWDELVIPLMAGDGTMPDLLRAECARAGLTASVTTTTEAPNIPLPRTWEAYLAALGRKERYLVNRTLRDFTEWAGADAVFRRASTVEEITEGKRILRDLHHERWEGAAGGTFRSPLFLAFHDRMMPRLLELGALELIWLAVRSEPLSAMYSFRWAGKVHFYQCGRRMDVPKNIRPGGVLLYHSIRSAIESGLREFDFLGGQAVYKSQLALASRPLVTLRVTRPGVVEGLRLGVEWGKERLRPLVNRLRRRNGSPVPNSSPE